MTKVIFLLYRRDGLSRDDFLREWRADRHVAIARKVPGLRKWVQNHAASDPAQGEPVCDGIGELWFDSPEAMQSAFESEEFAATMEDVGRFTDLERSRALAVDEFEVC